MDMYLYEKSKNGELEQLKKTSSTHANIQLSMHHYDEETNSTELSGHAVFICNYMHRCLVGSWL